MRQLISILWRAVVLFVAAIVGLLVGGTVPALRVYRTLSHTANAVRTYDFDWLIAVLLVYLLLLAFSALRGRLRQSWPASTIALVLTVAGVLLFTQFGVKETAL